jgi:hypothetical protein
MYEYIAVNSQRDQGFQWYSSFIEQMLTCNPVFILHCVLFMQPSLWQLQNSASVQPSVLWNLSHNESPTMLMSDISPNAYWKQSCYHHLAFFTPHPSTYPYLKDEGELSGNLRAIKFFVPPVPKVCQGYTPTTFIFLSFFLSFYFLCLFVISFFLFLLSFSSSSSSFFYYSR